MRQNWFILGCLIAYTLVIILPPIVHGYVYPINGDDFALHLTHFDRIKSGENPLSTYLGQDIIGYPLVWVNNITRISIDSLFFWFNFAALWLVGVIGFVLVAKFVDWRLGLLYMPLVIFVTPSTLNLFDTGAVFDLLTIGVLFPLLLFCGMQLWASKKWQLVIPLVCICAAVIVFHTIGIWGKLMTNSMEMAIPSLAEFSQAITGYMMIMLFLVPLAVVVYRHRDLALVGNRVKLLAVVLFCVAVLLLVLVFTGIIGWSLRIAVDLAIMLPLLVACLWGIVLKMSPNRMALVVLGFIVVSSGIPCLFHYVQYNSAIKPVDMEAISYVNSLDGDYYSCSSEVAPWIYGRYLNKEYKEGELPYVERSEPMTPRTTPGCVAYWMEGKSEPEGAVGDATEFVGGRIKVVIYQER